MTSYCRGVAKIATVAAPTFDEGVTEPERRETLTRFGAQMVLLYEEQAANAPRELLDEIEAVRNVYRQLVRTPDIALLTSPELVTNQQRLGEFDAANCGVQSIRLEAAEYSFEGLPALIEEGIMTFELENKGNQTHDLGLYRVNDDAELAAQEVPRLSRGDLEDRITPLSVESAPAGTTTSVVATLSPGEHVLICLQPVGGRRGGPAHYTRGMFKQFNVT
jgi:hypothetical protein